MALPSMSTRWVIVSAWSSRVVAAGASIYSLRILSHSLSSADYAVLIVILGLGGWFALVDLGVGYASQNAITARITQGEDPAREVLSAYLMLAFITTVLVLLLYQFRLEIAATLFGKIRPAASQALGETFFRSALVLIASASLGLSTKVLYAMHRGYVANGVAALAPLIGLTALSLGVASAQDKIAYAVLALHGPTALACGLLAALQISRAVRRRLTLSWSTFSAIAKASRGFFLFNLLGVAVLQIDYLVMSQKIPPVEIIQYYMTGKFFFFVAFFNQAILFAVWPTLTAQYSVGNVQTIRRKLKHLVMLSAGVTLTATLAVVTLRSQLSAFLAPGTPFEMRTTVVLGFGAVALIRCLTDPFAIFLQSIGKLKPLIVCAGIQALVSAGLQWGLADILGIEGILLALLLSFLLTSAWALPLASKELLSDQPRRSNDSPEKSRMEHRQ